MRVPTDGGTVWFKANEAAMTHEAAVLELVDRHVGMGEFRGLEFLHRVLADPSFNQNVARVAAELE